MTDEDVQLAVERIELSDNKDVKVLLPKQFYYLSDKFR